MFLIIPQFIHMDVFGKLNATDWNHRCLVSSGLNELLESHQNEVLEQIVEMPLLEGSIDSTMTMSARLNPWA